MNRKWLVISHGKALKLLSTTSVDVNCIFQQPSQVLTGQLNLDIAPAYI